MFRIQIESNYGTSTPAVARTALQGSDILQHFQCPDDQTNAARTILFELQRHLIKCVEIRDQVHADVVAGNADIQENGVQIQAGGRGVSLPSVLGLHSRAEAFLQSAKLAIAQTGNLVAPFYGNGFHHKFHELLKWAKGQFGESDQFVQVINNWEPFVKRMVTMRNAVDHPSNNPGGKLETENFNVKQQSDSLHLVEPTWGLSGEIHKELLPDFDENIENIIVLGEEILMQLFYKLKGNHPLVIHEIPIEKRDPINPRRLTVGLG